MVHLAGSLLPGGIFRHISSTCQHPIGRVLVQSATPYPSSHPPLPPAQGSAAHSRLRRPFNRRAAHAPRDAVGAPGAAGESHADSCRPRPRQQGWPGGAGTFSAPSFLPVRISMPCPVPPPPSCLSHLRLPACPLFLHRTKLLLFAPLRFPYLRSLQPHSPLPLLPSLPSSLPTFPSPRPIPSPSPPLPLPPSLFTVHTSLNESREVALQRLQQQRRTQVKQVALFALAASAVAGFMWWRKRRNERREREYAQQREAATNDALTLQGAGAAGAWPEEFPPLLPAAARDPSSRRNQQLEEILEAVEEIREAQREERGVGRGEGQEEEEEEGLDLDPEHELPAEQVCVVCAGRVRRAVFIPCGHRVCCLRCARAVKESSSLCPICRRFVRRVYQVFDT
ncbi:unnamed protein product [Closterium sp. NIES-54]